MAATLTIAKPPGFRSRNISAIAFRPFRRRGIQDVERRHQVERCGREGGRGDAGAGEQRATGHPAQAKPGFRDVEAVGAADLIQERQVGAGAAAAVEQASHASVAGLCGRMPQERIDERTKASKPEMTRFSVRGRAQKMVHPVVLEDCIVYPLAQLRS
jgi:hypothetical protein